MKNLFIALALLMSANQVLAVVITVDFETSPASTFTIEGSFNRFEPPVNNGYYNLANYTNSDYVGFFYVSAGSELKFTHTDNLFDLLELSMIGAFGSQTATLVGYNGSVSTYSQDVSLDRFTVDHLLLGWTDLTAFSIVTGSDYVEQPGHCCSRYSSRQIGFDNIVIDTTSIISGPGPGPGPGPVISVSEPSTLALLSLGLFGLVYSRRNNNV